MPTREVLLAEKEYREAKEYYSRLWSQKERVEQMLQSRRRRLESARERERMLEYRYQQVLRALRQEGVPSGYKQMTLARSQARSALRREAERLARLLRGAE